MNTIRIGIVKEGKTPPDERVPLVPEQCAGLMERYPAFGIKVESSRIRCFGDEEYQKLKIPVAWDVSDCEVLLGVKEVPLEQLVANKTYFFFSHTIKKQPYNRKLLQELVRKNIRMIDYECLVDEQGIRIIAFGKWAGIVGAHNGLYTWGRKTGKLQLKRVTEYKDFEALKKEYEKIEVPPLRIAITGDGRVAGGAVEVMDLLSIKRVAPEDYPGAGFGREAVYTQLSPKDIYAHKEGRPFSLKEFFARPQDYVCDFKKWYSKTDLMINAIYWDSRAPRYFTLEEMRSPDFEIIAIADISCDINGSVPATSRPTTIVNPVMGYDPQTGKETIPFQPHTIDIMAIDNLPNELPRDASESFGEILGNVVLPELLKPHSDILERATITEGGNLTKRFEYLRDYLEAR